MLLYLLCCLLYSHSNLIVTHSSNALVWLSQLAFKSLGSNPNSNAISVQFLECFSEKYQSWERKRDRERERDIFIDSFLSSLCWLLGRTWQNGSRFYNLLLFIFVFRCITFHGHLSQVRTWQKTSLIKDPWGVSFILIFYVYTMVGLFVYIFIQLYKTSQPAGYHNE